MRRPPEDRASLQRLLGGRRRWNGVRQTRAMLRRARLARMLLAYDLGARPRQVDLAARLGVRQGTISKDLRAIRDLVRRGVP